MNLYKSLNINQRITLKELCPEIIGVEFHKVIKILTFKQIMDIVQEKLEIYGN